MPLYIFCNEHTGEIKEVIQGMNDPHVYSENGVEWKRVWAAPQASIDTQVNPFSSQEFVAKTANKKGTLGNLWDASKELSIKRQDKEGVSMESTKKAYWDNWSKVRKGKKPPQWLVEGRKPGI